MAAEIAQIPIADASDIAPVEDAPKRVLTIGERVDRAVQADKTKIAKLQEEIKTLKAQLANAKRGTSRIHSIPNGSKKAKKAEVEEELDA
jgi:uncharacterized small protein (DUF1192 family)